MPDVVGVRLGMSPQEALLTLHKQYPKDLYQEMKVTWWPGVQKPDYGFNILAMPGGTPDAYLSFTAPPNRQLVWKVVRHTYKIHANRAVLLAALREKYGKESFAMPDGGGPAAGNDMAIGHMIWLFDEHGARAPLPAAQAFQNFGTIWQCYSSYNGSMGNEQPTMPKDDNDIDSNFRDWCTSFVGIHVTLMQGQTREIIENMTTEMVDVPLAARTAHASAMWQRALAEKAHQEDVERSKKAKPSL